MSFYSDQAAELQQTASDLGARLKAEGASLDEATFDALCEQRDALLDRADDMVIADVQATLGQLKSVDQPRVAQATASLRSAVNTIRRLDQIAAIVSAGVTLASAIASANPGAIFDGVVCVEKAVAAAAPKPQLFVKAAPVPPAVAGLSIAAAADPTKPT